MLPYLDMPKPLSNFGSTKSLEGGVTGVEADVRHPFNLPYMNVDSMRKHLEQKVFDGMSIHKHNKRRPYLYHIAPQFRDSVQQLDDIDNNKPKEGAYVFSFSAPRFRYHETNFKQTPTFFDSIQQINKLINEVHYPIALKQLYDFQKHHGNNFKIIKTIFIDEYKNLSELDIGKQMLKNIIQGEYIENYIKYRDSGYVGKNIDYDKLKRKEFKIEGIDLVKAIDFEQIATLSIFVSTIPGFMYCVKPIGLVFNQRGNQLEKTYGYQELDMLHFGAYKDATILTKSQKYIDEIALYHMQINFGEILTFMHKSPNPYDIIECKNHYRLLCLLIGGKNNMYEQVKQAYYNFMFNVSKANEEKLENTIRNLIFKINSTFNTSTEIFFSPTTTWVDFKGVDEPKIPIEELKLEKIGDLGRDAVQKYLRSAGNFILTYNTQLREIEDKMKDPKFVDQRDHLKTLGDKINEDKKKIIEKRDELLEQQEELLTKDIIALEEKVESVEEEPVEEELGEAIEIEEGQKYKQHQVAGNITDLINQVDLFKEFIKESVFEDPEFWKMLYYYIIYSNEKLKKETNKIYNIKSNDKRIYVPDIKIIKRKTIYKIINPHSRDNKSLKEWMEISKINIGKNEIPKTNSKLISYTNKEHIKIKKNQVVVCN
jgi:hypothetical protein